MNTNEARKTLNRSDIAKIQEVSLRRLMDSKPEDSYTYGIRMTSGTSGTGPIVSVLRYGTYQFSFFSGNRRVIVCIGSRNGQLAKVVHLRKQKNDFAEQIILPEINDMTPELGALLDDFSPDAITGSASFVARLAPCLLPRTGEAVRTLRLAGERVTALHASLLRSSFPNARVSMQYAVSELGPVGEQCAHLAMNQYHPAPGVTLEITDMDEDGAGDMIVRKRMPDGTEIGDYFIGDTGRFLTQQCPCGEAVTFEHLGRRGYDYIKIAGALVKQDELDRVMPGLMRFMDDYRVEVSEVLDNGCIKGKLVLRAYSHAGPPTPALIQEIARDFSNAIKLTPTRSLSQLVASGDFLPLSIDFSSTAFPSKNKNVKLMHRIS